MEFSPPTDNESKPESCTGWRRKLHPAAIRQTNRQYESPLVGVLRGERTLVSYVAEEVEEGKAVRAKVYDKNFRP